MCGLFGYVSSSSLDRPDFSLIKKLALTNESLRGGHAWGVAWVDKFNRLKSYKEAGKIRADFMCYLLEDAVHFVGHTRYATHGDKSENINNHPHSCDGGWICHNGVLPDYHEIRASFFRPPVSECDSELLAIAWEESPSEHLAKRADWMLETCQPSGRFNLAMLGIWRDKMIAVRQGNPLSYLTVKNSKYISTLSCDGVTGWKSFGDDTLTAWKYPDGVKPKQTTYLLTHRKAVVSQESLWFSKSKPWGN